MNQHDPQSSIGGFVEEIQFLAILPWNLNSYALTLYEHFL